MRLAAVDVGTNSTRLLVADVADGVIVAEQAREMVITRLGKGVDRSGRFDPAALARRGDPLGLLGLTRGTSPGGRPGCPRPTRPSGG